MKILIINGPNLNLLGKREPEIYGNEGFEHILDRLRKDNPEVNLGYFQSNIEGELINKLHQVDEENINGIILNAGGYSHTSVALADAVAGIKTPVVSVHISNIYQRESERHKELLAQYVVGGVFGLGIDGYTLALHYFTSR